MQGRGLEFRLLALALTFGVAALPTPLFASGFQLVEQNASGLGNAYAGQAAGAKNASAVFFNPALMTRVKGWNVMGSIEPIGVGTTFADSASKGPVAGPLVIPVPLGNDGGDAGKWIPVPNIYGAGQITDRIWVGLGVNVPFGLETDWDPAWMGRFHANKSKVQTINVNPSIAFQVTDTLSLGGGVNYQHLKADLGSSVASGGLTYAAAGQAIAASGQPAAVQAALMASILNQLGGPAGLATEATTLVTGDSNAWGFNVGALLEVGEQAHIGVSYRSKVKHDVEGTVDFTGATALAESGPTAPIGTAINARFADGNVMTTIEMPDTFSIAGGLGAGQARAAGRLDLDRLGVDPVARHHPRGRPDGRLQRAAARLGLPEQRAADLREHLARRPRRQHQDERQVDAAPRHRVRPLAGAEHSTARRACPTTTVSGRPPASSGGSRRRRTSTWATRTSSSTRPRATWSTSRPPGRSSASTAPRSTSSARS